MAMVKPEPIRSLQKLDWELPDADTRYGTHKFHPYSAKYIPQIPRYLISSLSKNRDTVLDPFLGSGTTLIEANALGRNSVGVDINPLACMISKAKTTPLTKSEVSLVECTLIGITKKARHLDGRKWREYIESNVDCRVFSWFQDNILEELVLVKSEVDRIRNPAAKNFMLVAMSSILRRVSKAESGFGNLMISKNPPYKKDAARLFTNSVRSMIRGIEEYRSMHTKSRIDVINEDSRNLGFIPESSMDLICTHPPYMAAVPYAEYQKLSLWWLGMSNGDLDRVLIGGRRRRPDIGEVFEKDMDAVIGHMYRVLKPRHYCVIVIGNPMQHKKLWRLDTMLANLGKSHGLDLVAHIERGKYKETVGKMKKEYVMIFKKA